jgi:hypothetical protein
VSSEQNRKVTWPRGKLFFSLQVSHSLKSAWQKHVLVSQGYLELGMFDDAANALEEIEPEDKTRKGFHRRLHKNAGRFSSASPCITEILSSRG